MGGETLQSLALSLSEAREEIERLRAALAQSDLPCAYCSLPKDEWAKCASGFPGCDRADDAMGCPELGASLSIESATRQRDEALAALKASEERGERLSQELASARCPQETMFPIMGGPKVPWSLIEPYEAQAHTNHGQTLKRLAERGGLSICEAMAVMSSVRYDKRPIAKPNVEDLLDFIAERKAKAVRRARSDLENGPAVLADATSNPPLSDLPSLRKGVEVVGEAAAYDFVAGWHERQAKLFREMADDDPRTAEPQRKRAFEAAIHHAASAAALRNRAADDRRAALVSGSREDGDG